MIRALLAQTASNPIRSPEVILGQVLTAGSGQNPARQALDQGGHAACGPGDDHQQGAAGPD